MAWTLTGLLALLVAMLGALVRPAARRRPGPPAGDAPAAPAAAVIVPFRGSAAEVERTLLSLIAQDHPDFEILAVTESHAEPAAVFLRGFLADHASRPGPRMRHLVAGPAAGCGQKNRNMVAGVRAADPTRPVLVFCDGGRIAPPCWLRRLTVSLAPGSRRIVTGYHYLRMERTDLVSVGRAVTVSFLRSLQAWPRLRQPWGGSLAIPRALFDSLGVAEFWEKQVVDDVALARLLRRARVPVDAASPDADLVTLLAAPAPGGWTGWLTRQIQFVRFHFPFAWIAGGAMGLCLVALLLGVGAELIAAVFWQGPPGPPLAGLTLTGVLVAWMEVLRRRYPTSVPPARWIAAGFTAIGVAAWCFARSATTRTLRWQGRTYRVAPGGGVRSIALDPASG